ncbi:MAG: hypothetical protein LBB21_05740 [Holosporaceae bacterium]|jgi:hypothetical protein|nr:hypothetical protein [Holosporaceae bacterium]
MLIPWDLGLINALKKGFEYAIFPSNPPEENRRTPYLIFELQNFLHGKNFTARVEFTLTIVDQKEVTSASFDVLRAINKVISKELTLIQEEFVIGSAKIKTDAVESKKNSLVLKMVAILKLSMVYKDE